MNFYNNNKIRKFFKLILKNKNFSFFNVLILENFQQIFSKYFVRI